MPLGSPGDFVLDGDPAPTPKGAELHPIFGPRAWIKMPFGAEIGLGLRDIVFDVDPATARKKAHPLNPIFGPCLLVRK